MKLNPAYVYVMYSQKPDLYPNIVLLEATRKSIDKYPNGVLITGFFAPEGRDFYNEFTLESEDDEKMMLSRMVGSDRVFFTMQRVSLEDTAWIFDPGWKWEDTLEHFEQYIDEVTVEKPLTYEAVRPNEL